MFASVSSYLPGLNFFYHPQPNSQTKTSNIFIPLVESPVQQSLDHSFIPIEMSTLLPQTTEELNKQWDALVDELTKKLIASSPDEESRKNFEAILSKLSFENIEKFFNHLIDNSVECSIDASIIQLLPLEQVIDQLKGKLPHFRGIEEWMEAVAASLPNEPTIFSSEKQHEHSRSRNVVTRFFPNLMNTFLRTFDLFDGARPPDTLYEYGVLVTLYFHFFKLPYFLFQGLSAFQTTPLNVLITGTCVLAMGAGLLYTYLRWIKKCPEKVSYCENLTEKMQQEPPDPVLCRDLEYAKALSCMGTGNGPTGINLVIIGEPGAGKTEWTKGLIQRLPDKKVFRFQNTHLFGVSSSVTSVSEKISEAFREVESYEQEVVFIFDEQGDAFDDRPKDLTICLKPALEKKKIQFIAVMTMEQWEELKKKDKSFEERYKPIVLEPMDKKQTKEVLFQRVQRHAPDIGITSEMLDKIIEETDQIKNHVQPRKAVNRLDEWINQIRNFNPADYKPKHLIDAELELANLKGEFALNYGLSTDPFSVEYQKHDKEIQATQAKVEEIRKEVEEQKVLIKKVIDLQKRQRQYARRAKQLVREVTVNPSLPQEKKEALQKEFIFTEFFACRKIKRLIDQMLTLLPPDLPIYGGNDLQKTV